MDVLVSKVYLHNRRKRTDKYALIEFQKMSGIEGKIKNDERGEYYIEVDISYMKEIYESEEYLKDENNQPLYAAITFNYSSPEHCQ